MEKNTDTSGYHETITQASLRAAYGWLDDAPPGESVEGTLERRLASPPGRSVWLGDYWSKDRLMSVEARRGWIEPDLKPLPWPAIPARAIREA